MTAPGELNRRLTLQAPVETDDGAGGVTRSYAAVTTLWAKVQRLSAQSEVNADRLGATLRLRIVIRARDDVTIHHRFAEGARLYRVLAVQPSADRRFLTIEAEARDS